MKLPQLLARLWAATSDHRSDILAFTVVLAVALASAGATAWGFYLSPRARQRAYDQELEQSYQAQLRALDERRQRDSAAAYERGRLDQLKRSEAIARTDYEAHLRARPTTGPLQLPDFSARPGPAPNPTPAAR